MNDHRRTEKSTSAMLHVQDRPKKVFISYAHQDKEWLDRLKVHLTPLIRDGSLDPWDDTRIPPGAHWADAIREALAEASVAVLLVSADYLASEFVASNELPALLEAEHRRGLILIPVIVRPCRFEVMQGLMRLQAVNSAERPVQLMADAEREILWTKVAHSVDDSLRRVRVGPPQREGTFGWNLSMQRNSFFTGREDVLKHLENRLASEHVVGVTGLGGIGKTQVALEFAYRHRTKYDHVFWVRAESRLAITASLMEVAGIIGLPEGREADDARAAEAARRWLEDNDGWLLVFDAADDPELVRSVWPQTIRGHIIVTSRSPLLHSIGIAAPIELERMNDQESVDFLRVRSGRQCSEKEEEEAVLELLHELGCLPLALEQAAAYITANRSRFDDYLRGYRRRRLAVLRPPVAGGYPESIATTWALNFREVEQVPHSADLLRFSAFLAPDDIPLELIENSSGDLGDALAAALKDVREDPLVLDEALEPLMRYSLIHRDLGNRTYSIHRIVQAVILDGMTKGIQKVWAERAVRAVQKSFAIPDFPSFGSCGRLIRHAQVCANHIGSFGFAFPEAGYLLLDAGNYLRLRAQYAESGRLLQQAVELRRVSLGPQHSAVAHALESAAKLYRAQGRYEEAHTALEQALVILKVSLGARHAEVARVLNSLAALFRSQYQLDKAEEVAREALDIHKEALGTSDPNLAKTLTTLATILHDKGHLDEAGALLGRALSIEEVAFGKEHPNLVPSLTMLAEITRERGEHSKAEELVLRALAIEESAKGASHPGLAWGLGCLARIQMDRADYANAELNYQRALEIRRTALGANHPLVTETVDQYAALLRTAGRAAEADKLLAQKDSSVTRESVHQTTERPGSPRVPITRT